MVALDYPQVDLFAVRISVHEAILNAIQHGHRGDPAKAVQLNYLVTEEYVLVEVIDKGPGFVLPQPPACGGERPGRHTGQGLFLMRFFMTWVRFNGRGNWVVLCRLRSKAEAPRREAGGGPGGA
jgi:anti-sigma regulatory factor (Ser/Thr protein kinase)